METIKITKTEFEQIKNAENTLQSIYELSDDLFPKLRGGLDHIEKKENEIIIYDRGMSYGDHIDDFSFRVIPE